MKLTALIASLLLLPTLAHAQSDRDATDAEERYAERAISADRVFYGFYNQYGAQVGSAQQDHFYVGKYKEPLVGAKFYETIGKPDLANVYNQRRKKRIALLASGTTLTVVGAGAGLGIGLGAPIGDVKIDKNGKETTTNDHSTAYIASATVIGCAFGISGTVLMFWALATNPEAMSASEKLKAADEYNQALRRSLGLGALKTIASSTRFVPTGGNGQLGVALAGKF